jgi:hypothetical protein
MASRKFANSHSATFLTSISKLTFEFVERNREIAIFYRENTGLNTVKKPGNSQIRENTTRENPGFPVL